MDDEAIRLARRLLGGRTSTFGWGGRTRVVVRDDGPLSRWTAANTAPAFRRVTRTFRSVQALRFAIVRGRAIEFPPSPLTGWLPADLQGLSPTSAIIGTPGGSRSIVVSLSDSRGKPVAALKVATTRRADEGIAREVDALADPAVSGKAPTLLWSGDLGPNKAMAVEHVSGRSGAVDGRGVDQALSVLPSVPTEAPRVQASRHPWVEAVLLESDLAPGGVAHLRGTWPVVRVHGDLAPWNLIRRPDGSIVAIDWEGSRSDGLPGVDLAHHAMATRMRIFHEGPTEAAEEARARLIGRLGLDAEAARSIVALTAASVAQRERVQGAPVVEVQRWDEIAAAQWRRRP